MRNQQEIDDINEYNSGSDDFDYDEEGEEEFEDMDGQSSEFANTQEIMLKKKNTEK